MMNRICHMLGYLLLFFSKYFLIFLHLKKMSRIKQESCHVIVVESHVSVMSRVNVLYSIWSLIQS